MVTDMCKVAVYVVVHLTVATTAATNVVHLEGVIPLNDELTAAETLLARLRRTYNAFKTNTAISQPAQRDASTPLEYEEPSRRDTASGRNLASGVTNGISVQETKPSISILPLEVGNIKPNGCADINPQDFAGGSLCGAPLSLPCFDYSSCPPPSDSNGPSIYVYDSDCSLADSEHLAITHGDDEDRHHSSYWRQAAREAGSLAKTYDTACLFIEVNAFGHDEPCAPSAPSWNGGANHAMVEFTDDVSM